MTAIASGQFSNPNLVPFGFALRMDTTRGKGGGADALLKNRAESPKQVRLYADMATTTEARPPPEDVASHSSSQLQEQPPSSNKHPTANQPPHPTSSDKPRPSRRQSTLSPPPLPTPSSSSVSRSSSSSSSLPSPGLHSSTAPKPHTSPTASPHISVSGTDHLPTAEEIEHIMEDFFSASSTCSENEENLETVLKSVLRDPLEECMEGIEDLATGILKTGKLSLQGEPGDMSKLQPVFLGLQANEKDMAQLLPQLMQIPFFEQHDLDETDSLWSSFDGHSLNPEDFLARGHIRLGLPVDVAIFHFLNRHCAKGGRQAEEIIHTSQTIDYVKRNPGKHLMPVLIFSASVLSCPNSPLMRFPVKRSPPANFSREWWSSDEVREGELAVKSSPVRLYHHKDSDSGISDGDTASLASSLSMQSGGLQKNYLLAKDNISQSSLLSVETHHTTSSSSLTSNPSATALPGVAPASSSGRAEVYTTIEETPASNSTPGSPAMLNAPIRNRRRKTNTFHRPIGSQSSIESTDDSSMHSTSRLIGNSNPWNASITDNSIIVAQYGDSTYPLLMWNPKFKIDFQVSSSVASTAGLVATVDSHKPLMKIRLHNHTSLRIAFSLRTYRQTTIHNSHVVYPLHGLQVLEHQQYWEERADIHPESTDKNEYFTVELFISTLEGRPSWNVLRKYVVVKPKKGRSQNGKRTLSKPSVLQLPGVVERKFDNLRLLIAHGLQCVVKNKHSTAEVIFTQALFLPDFQRLELKAFSFICLAVVAYRRKNAGEIDSLTHAMNLVNSVDKLVEACELAAVTMPRTLQLVKQLRKELNFSAAVKTLRKQARHKHPKLTPSYHSEGTTTLVTEEGGFLSHHRTSLLIPRGSLHSQTEMTLSSPSHQQLEFMMSSTGWGKGVRILCVVHIQATPLLRRFEQQVKISCALTDVNQAAETLHPVLLMHSSYLREWENISQDPLSIVNISKKKVDIATNRTGWLAAVVVNVDPTHIAAMALQTLSVAPTTLQVQVFGKSFSDDIMQVTVVVAPHSDSEEQTVDSNYLKSINHTPISFPHPFEAYVGEDIVCHLRGAFEPDTSSGETDLDFQFKVTPKHSSMSGKFIHLTTPSSRCYGGKLVISRQGSSTSGGMSGSSGGISGSSGGMSGSSGGISGSSGGMSGSSGSMSGSSGSMSGSSGGMSGSSGSMSGSSRREDNIAHISLHLSTHQLAKRRSRLDSTSSEIS